MALTLDPRGTAAISLVFTGPMGAGKTTAIASISDLPPVTTEVPNTDPLGDSKSATTVAMDYGMTTLPDGSTLRLYGTPGQARFDFLWRMFADDALGAIVLADNRREAPLRDLSLYLAAFQDLADSGAVVVGLVRTDTHPEPSFEEYARHLSASGLALPVMPVDVRNPEQVLALVELLLQHIELRQEAST